MLLVLIAVAMCTIMALSFLASQEPTAVVASNIDRKTQARAIAESALKMAIDYVNEDADWRSDKSSGLWMSDIALDGGTFTLTGTDEDDGNLADDNSEAVLLTVVATYEGVTHRVSARVTPGSEESSTNRLLLVTGNGTSPSSTDRNKRDLFESWGYVVTIIDDSASTSTYNDAVAVNDVVYVSEEVSSGNVNTKLRGATIGVVNDEGYLHDDFGFTSGNTGASNGSTSLDIVDNTHPITTGFSTGSLTILTSTVYFGSVSTSSLASGVTVLADRSGSNTSANLMVADVGDTLRYGAAAGRRVMFPNSNDMNVNNLTADGQLLLRRCVEWAAGGGAEPEGPTPTLLALYEFNEQAVPDPTLVGHWKLDEAATPGFGGISAGEKVELKDNAIIDSFNSSSGAYGSTTPFDQAVVTLNSTGSDDFKMSGSSTINGDAYIGPGGSASSVFDLDDSYTITGDQLVLTNAIDIETLSSPSGMPSSSGDFKAEDYDNVTINSDRRYEEFEMTDHATVTISGDVTIWVRDEAKIKDNSRLIIPDGSSLTFYAGDDFDVENSAQVNNDSTAATRLTIYAYGSKHVDMKDSSRMAAIVYTNDDFHVKDSIHFYGKVLALKEVKIEGNAQVHQDLSLGGFEASSSGGGSAAPSVQLDDKLTMRNNAIIDGYNASTGVYSSSNRHLATTVLTDGTSNDEVYLDNADIYGDVFVGDGASLSSAIELRNGSTITGTQAVSTSHLEIPSYDTPSGFGGHSGNQTYDNDTTTWSSNLHFNKLTMRNNSRINVSGDVEIRVSNQMEIDNSHISLNAGATLTIWVGHNITMRNGATINNDSSRAADVTIIQYGNNRDTTIDNATIAGSLHVANDLAMRNNAQLYGSLVVEDDVTLDNAGVHINVGTASSDDSGSGGSISVAKDETGTANDGTVHGSMAGGAPGVDGTAYEFDGTDDYVEIAHDASYLLDRGSVGLHFYADSLGGEQALFSKDSTGNDNGGHLHLYTDGTRLKARIQTTSDDPYRTGSSVELESSGSALSDSTWHHAMVTWGDGQFRLYLDGVLVDSADHLGGLGSTSGGSGNDEPIVIGAGSINSGDQSATPINDEFTGRIDDVRIYDMPLDSGQAANLAGGSDPGSRTAPGYVIPDTSGYDTALDLVIYDTSAINWLPGGGLQFTGDTLATSQTYATKLHDAIEANEAFAIEVILERATPASTASPSRIVSYADGPSAHNFMVGQDASHYEVRSRDSATSSNGNLSPEFVSSTDLASSGDAHLILSYQGGEVSVYIDGVLDESATAGGTLNNWDADHFLVLAGAYTGGSHWQGTLKRVAIYDNAFNAIQAENVYNGDDPGSGESGVSGTGSVQWDEQD